MLIVIFFWNVGVVFSHCNIGFHCFVLFCFEKSAVSLLTVFLRQFIFYLWPISWNVFPCICYSLLSLWCVLVFLFLRLGWDSLASWICRLMFFLCSGKFPEVIRLPLSILATLSETPIQSLLDFSHFTIDLNFFFIFFLTFLTRLNSRKFLQIYIYLLLNHFCFS